MRYLFSLALLGALPALADVTVTGGTLLNTPDGNQIATTIFGSTSNVTFTGIFTSITNDLFNAPNFHAAANGRGPTVSLIQTDLGLLGGYNPQSWSSTNFDYTYTRTGPRTAFIFNLTTHLFIGQRQDQLGTYQTYNAPVYGPTFGGGHDLWSGRDAMSSGYANGFSFGSRNLFGDNSFIPRYFSISKVEVFTVTQSAPVSATPEPSAYVLSFAGLALLGFGKRIHKRRA